MNLMNLFRPNSAEQLAQRELEDAKRELLTAQTHRDYYDSQVRFNETRIARLRHTLADMHTEEIL
jgi:hypothetical protein